MRALIVDDEKDIGWMLTKILTTVNLSSDNVQNIRDARSRISENEYHIFFLDLNLPDGTGFDLIPAIRKKNPNAKIIIISAYDGVLESSRAEETGVDIFIKKPFTKRQVLQAVEDLNN